MDDAIRHKQLNISSRFSPRVAGENDFLQTVINKVIAAKEVNHKGQGTYCSLSMLVYVKLLIASSVAWDYYKFGVRSGFFFGSRKYICTVPLPSSSFSYSCPVPFAPRCQSHRLSAFSAVSITRTPLCFWAGNCFRKLALMPRSCGLCPPRAEGRNSPFLPFLLLVWQLHSQQLASRQDDRGISPIRGEEWPQDKAALLFLPLVFTGLPFLYTALRNVPRI